MIYKRRFIAHIQKGLEGSHCLLQIIIGPRQVGKTTAAMQIQKEWAGKTLYTSADDSLPPGPEWIQHHWQMARREKEKPPLLILDEVQKIQGWSRTVKALWDEDRRLGLACRVMLLGSSSLLLQKGLAESLGGRFMLHSCPHWSYGEMRDAFGFSLEDWLYFGGYPGTGQLKADQETWKAYIRDSLIETVLNKDIFQMQNITKPALFRHLFLLAIRYPAEILSYNKMLGQLQDAGNTTTLAHYLHLLSSAFLVDGIELYKVGERPKRGSSPKLIIRNNALITALSKTPFSETRNNPELWGRIVENAVGAQILNSMPRMNTEVYYWRKTGAEVDFVVQTPETTWAIEVKSSKMRPARGLGKFLSEKKNSRPFIVGGSGMQLEEFFATDPNELFL